MLLTRDGAFLDEQYKTDQDTGSVVKMFMTVNDAHCIIEVFPTADHYTLHFKPESRILNYQARRAAEKV